MVTLQLSTQQVNTLREALKIVELIDLATKGGSTNAAPKVKKETKKERDARTLQMIKDKFK